MSQPDVVAAWARHLNPAFVKLLGVLGYGRVFTRAEGCFLWDDQGRRYLDALAGFGATALGHNPPRLTSCIQDFFAASPLNLCHTGPAPHAAALAEALAAQFAPLTVSLLASGGAEGVEAGIKLAIAATGRSGLLSFLGGYHGTSLGTLGIMGAPRLRAPFEAALPATTRLPYGAWAPVREALASKRYAAVVVEPLQAEGGVIAPPPGWLDGIAELCKKTGTLLILDEVQTGLGRTGTLADPVVPDVRVFGKALGGGLIPVSVAMTTPEWHARAYGTMERFDLHSSTYGGGALGCAVALEALRALAALTPQVAPRGAALLARLRAGLAGHPFVQEVRGQGLLIGIALGPTGTGLAALAPGLVEQVSRQVFGQWLAVRLLEAGVLAQPAALAWNVLRIEPPLTIDDAGLDTLADTIISVLGRYTTLPTLLADVTARMGEQAWRGGAFR